MKSTNSGETREIIEAIEKEYMLVRKGPFWYMLGGIVAALGLASVATYQRFSGYLTDEYLEKKKAEARELVKNMEADARQIAEIKASIDPGVTTYLEEPRLISGIDLSTNSAIRIELGEAVPKDATQVLFMASIVSGNAGEGERGFVTVRTMTDAETSGAINVLVAPYGQAALAFNSDAAWLPVGKERAVYSEYSGTPRLKNMSAQLWMVGYRERAVSVSN